MPARRPVARPRADAAARVATLSVHTSPLDQPGAGDAGGMNVYVVEVSRRLAARGIAVDVFTRATSSDLPPVVEMGPGVTVRHVSAGPFEGLGKEELPAQLCAFTAAVLREEAQHEPGYYDVVHSHYWLSGQVGWLARDRWSVPLIHTAHTLAKVKNEALADGDRARAARPGDRRGAGRRRGRPADRQHRRGGPPARPASTAPTRAAPWSSRPASTSTGFRPGDRAAARRAGRHARRTPSSCCSSAASSRSRRRTCCCTPPPGCWPTTRRCARGCGCTSSARPAGPGSTEPRAAAGARRRPRHRRRRHASSRRSRPSSSPTTTAPPTSPSSPATTSPSAWSRSRRRPAGRRSSPPPWAACRTAVGRRGVRRAGRRPRPRATTPPRSARCSPAASCSPPAPAGTPPRSAGTAPPTRLVDGLRRGDGRDWPAPPGRPGRARSARCAPCRAAGRAMSEHASRELDAVIEQTLRDGRAGARAPGPGPLAGRPARDEEAQDRLRADRRRARASGSRRSSAASPTRTASSCGPSCCSTTPACTASATPSTPSATST